MENQKAYQEARKAAKAKVQFYFHLAVYVGVMILLVIINLTTNPEFFWVKFPMMGWGLAVLIHGVKVYAFSGKSSIAEKMIDKKMKEEGW